MKASVVDITGKKLGSFDLPTKLFGLTPNEPLLAQYIRVFRHRQRQADARAKTRGEVTGTTAKVWRQKGTGRARHGSRKAPIFVKGGKAHGPTGGQNYTLTLSKEQRRQALCSALSSQNSNLLIIEGLEKLEPKTKVLNEVLENALKLGKGRVTIVLDKPLENIIKASKNLPGLSITQASRLNAHEVLSTPKLVFTKASIDVLEKKLAKKDRK